MNTVYIVVGLSGRYEDAKTENLAAFLDRDKAQAFIDDEEKLQADLASKEHELSEFFNEYSHQFPTINYPEYPRWDSGLGQAQITKEMRDERARIFNEKEKRIREHNIKLDEWKATALTAINKKRIELGMEPEIIFGLISPMEHVNFEIQEIELFI
jgi:hypothetical protein